MKILKLSEDAVTFLLDVMGRINLPITDSLFAINSKLCVEILEQLRRETRTPYTVVIEQDSEGRYCGSVEELHAHTDAISLVDVLRNLAEAIEVALPNNLSDELSQQ